MERGSKREGASTSYSRIGPSCPKPPKSNAAPEVNFKACGSADTARTIAEELAKGVAKDPDIAKIDLYKIRDHMVASIKARAPRARFCSVGARRPGAGVGGLRLSWGPLVRRRHSFTYLVESSA